MEAHHVRRKLCTSRAKYRQGRELKAVKTYTVAQESQYILVLGLPAIHIQDKLLKSMGKYGTIVEWRHLQDYPSEEFTETLLFKYQRIQSARAAKRKTDDKSFYGGVLHACYAPEYETVDEVRRKMKERQLAYTRRLKQLEREKATYRHHKRSEQEEELDEEEEEEEEETTEEAQKEETASEFVPQDDRYFHPANQGHYPSQQGEMILPQQQGNAQYPAEFPPALPAPPSIDNPPHGTPPFPPPPHGAPHPPFPPHGVPPFPPPRPFNTRPHYPPNLQGLNSRPPGRTPNDKPHRYQNSSTPPSARGSSQSSSANSGGPRGNSPRTNFPLAGPAPPSGPYLPTGYKMGDQSAEKQKGKWKRRPNSEDEHTPKPASKPTVQQPSTTTQNNVMIKSYQPSKDTARFVPRQVSKVSLPKYLTSGDPVSETLRKNALTLKETAAGPSLPPEIEEEQETKRAMKRKDPEMEKVMQNIRDRVKKFAEKAMLPPQLKKKKTS